MKPDQIQELAQELIAAYKAADEVSKKRKVSEDEFEKAERKAWKEVATIREHLENRGLKALDCSVCFPSHDGHEIRGQYSFDGKDGYAVKFPLRELTETKLEELRKTQQNRKEEGIEATIRYHREELKRLEGAIP